MRLFILTLSLLAGRALAGDSDADALLLADQARPEAEAARESHWFVEGGWGQSIARDGGAGVSNQRLSIDVQLDKRIAPGWRLALADRLDLNRSDGPDRRHSVNTLKEAYLSWQVQEHQIIDLGRINARYGVAAGYNPADFFRAGAVRSVVSIDPNSLKTNRLGSVMLRGQTLWANGALTAKMRSSTIST